MTTKAVTICSSVIKVAALAGLFALAWQYDGALLYVFAASVGGVFGFEIAGHLPRKGSK